MEGFDYPIQHFEMMSRLTARLKLEKIQLLDHAYHYESFGSWLFTFTNFGRRYRIVYDGKGSCLRLEENISQDVKADWREIREKESRSEDPSDVIDAVLSLIGRL